jgi:hypothetical protein
MYFRTGRDIGTQQVTGLADKLSPFILGANGSLPII